MYMYIVHVLLYHTCTCTYYMYIYTTVTHYCPCSSVCTVHMYIVYIIYMYNTVQPRLADNPEVRTSTVMQTLRAVPNVSYVYQTTPEITLVRTLWVDPKGVWIRGVALYTLYVIKYTVYNMITVLFHLWEWCQCYL